jgi:MFS family permease
MTTAEVSTPGRAIGALTAYRVVSRAYFHLPILFVFLFNGNLSILAIELLVASYGIVVAIAPLVTGGLAKRLAPPVALAAGEVIKIGGLVALAAGPGITSALIGQILSGLGFALTAGADSALLSQLLSGDAFRKKESATQGWMFTASFVAGAIGAALFSRAALLPFLASAVAAVCAIVALALVRRAMPADKPAANPAGKPGSATASAAPDAETERAALAVAAKGSLFWQLYYSVNRAFLLAPYVGLIPYLLYTGLHLGLAWFGAVLGLYTLSGFAAARSCPKLLARYDAKTLAILPVVLTTGGLLLLAASTNIVFALLAIVALGLGGGTIRPTAMSNLEPFLRGLSGASRRTLTTRMEQTQAVLSGLILVVSAVVLSNDASVYTLFLALAGANLVIGVVVLTATRAAKRVSPVVSEA